MSFIVNLWLAHRRRVHRHSSLVFAAVGISCSLLLFGGAYFLLTHVTSLPAVTEPSLSAPSDVPAVGPDFSVLLPMAPGSTDYSVVRLFQYSRELYAVGFRSESGPMLALVSNTIVGYRLEGTLDLAVGRSPDGAIPTLHLWNGGDAPRVIAAVPQMDGWSAVVAMNVKDDGVTIIERMSPLSDIPPQYTVVGVTDSLRRSARFVDLDTDGQNDDLLVEVRQKDQPVRFEAYEQKGDTFAWRDDLAQTAQKSAELFVDAQADPGETLFIQAQ